MEQSINKALKDATDLYGALVTTLNNLREEVSIGPETTPTSGNNQQQSLQRGSQVFQAIANDPTSISDALQASVPTQQISSSVRNLMDSSVSVINELRQYLSQNNLLERTTRSENCQVHEPTAPGNCMCLPLTNEPVLDYKSDSCNGESELDSWADEPASDKQQLKSNPCLECSKGRFPALSTEQPVQIIEPCQSPYLSGSSSSSDLQLPGRSDGALNPSLYGARPLLCPKILVSIFT